MTKMTRMAKLGGMDAQQRYTKEDLRYAYEKGRKDGAEEERAKIPQSNAAAFQRVNRKRQQWRDFAKKNLELNQNYPGRARLSPLKIHVLTKFLCNTSRANRQPTAAPALGKAAHLSNLGTKRTKTRMEKTADHPALGTTTAALRRMEKTTSHQGLRSL